MKTMIVTFVLVFMIGCASGVVGPQEERRAMTREMDIEQANPTPEDPLLGCYRNRPATAIGFYGEDHKQLKAVLAENTGPNARFGWQPIPVDEFVPCEGIGPKGSGADESTAAWAARTPGPH